MKLRRLFLVTVLAPLAYIVTTPAHAAGCGTSASTAGPGYQVATQGCSTPKPSDPAPVDPTITYETYTCRDGRWVGGYICEPCPDGTWPRVTLTIDTVMDGWIDEYVNCSGPQLTQSVASAFRRVPVPVAKLSIQPPGGKTLVGLETILSTEVEPFIETFTLLGRQVQLNITPSTFTWHHGDGTTQVTDWGGRAYDGSMDMDRYITHIYEHKDTVSLSVTVQWSATWRIGTGPWRAVNGTVTRAGPPQGLRVVEAKPELVAP